MGKPISSSSQSFREDRRPKASAPSSAAARESQPSKPRLGFPRRMHASSFSPQFTMMYSKQAGFAVTVPRLIVKLVAATFAARIGAVAESTFPVLQITFNWLAPPSAASCVMVISLLAVTAVVLTVQVPVLAFVAQENIPAAAAEQEATEGLAAVPFAAQFVAVECVEAVKAPTVTGVGVVHAPATSIANAPPDPLGHSPGNEEVSGPIAIRVRPVPA